MTTVSNNLEAMGRVFVRTCLMIAVAAVLIAAPNPPEKAILEERVPAFSVRDETRVKALIMFARKNRIPLGIEVSDSELDQRVNVSVPSTNVRQAIHAILGNSRNYVVASLQGIVSIRLAGAQPPRWLDTTIPRFTIPRTTIASASASLWMALERHLDPARQGFVGSLPPGDPADLVGPLDIRGATVSVLLSHLLRASPQSSWIVTRPGTELEPPAAINRFWTTMYRAGLYAPGVNRTETGVRVVGPVQKAQVSAAMPVMTALCECACATRCRWPA